MRLPKGSLQSGQVPTTATLVLSEILSDWRRRDVLSVLDRFDDPESALLDGRVQARLPGRGRVGGAEDRLIWRASNGSLIGLFDEAFPPLLKHIPDPPLVLYYQGDLATLSLPTVAIVGARRGTSAGRDLAGVLARDLAGAGCCVVSGLAAGIDGAAHEGVLGARGPTAAFLGSGLEQVHPRRHVQLAKRIVDQGGVLLSEYSPRTPPRAFRFPERNRLISGASMAVVVVEATLKSGSLITARLALEQGRDVYACPGPVHSPLSEGCHELIRHGAGLAACAQDVLNGLGMEAPARDERPSLEAIPAQVYAVIGGEPQPAEVVAMRAQLDFARVCTILTELELMGFVRQVGLGYIRTLSNELE